MIACTVCVLLIATEGKTVLPFVAHTSKRKCFWFKIAIYLTRHY